VADRLAARRGAALALLALTPVIVGVCVDVAARPERVAAYAQAGLAMLAVDGTYGVIVLAALAYYLTMSWRKRCLASAVLLGPLTLARPAIALLGGALAAIVSHDALTTAYGISATNALHGTALNGPLDGRGADSVRGRPLGLVRFSAVLNACQERPPCGSGEVEGSSVAVGGVAHGHVVG
jgi:hypothetical protein